MPHSQPKTKITPRFFETASEFREWLEHNHASSDQLWVGFHKRSTGKPSLTWPESVDQALCFGWIDGIRKRVDQDSYMIRFTPRRTTSTWSNINVNRVRDLRDQGLMRPAGIRAFEAREIDNTGVYSYEQKPFVLPEEFLTKFKANKKAWAFFEEQAPWYRRTCTKWVMSARREETQWKRLAQLIDDSSHGRRIKELSRPAELP